MCGERYLYQRTADRARVFQLRCRSWNCPRCRPRRQQQLRAIAYAGHPVTFLTLTCNPFLHESPGDAARAMSAAWRALRRLIEAQHKGIKPEWMTVVEATKRGWPHLHVLTTKRWIDQKWLSAQWERLTGAKIVDIRRVQNPRQMASYVAKYVGKAPHKFMKLKRYYTTRGYRSAKPQRPAQYDWSNASAELHTGNFLTLGIALRGSGWQLEQAGSEYWELSRQADTGSTARPRPPP